MPPAPLPYDPAAVEFVADEQLAQLLDRLYIVWADIGIASDGGVHPWAVRFVYDGEGTEMAVCKRLSETCGINAHLQLPLNEDCGEKVFYAWKWTTERVVTVRPRKQAAAADIRLAKCRLKSSSAEASAT